MPGLPIIELSTTDYDVAERVAAVFGTSVMEVKLLPVHVKQVWRVRKRGSGAASLMRELQPFMGVRRQQQIDAALEGSP